MRPARLVPLFARVGLLSSGVVAAATPAVIQACAARTETLPAQGALALALTVGAFLAQIALAGTVEAWLASAVEPGRVVLPRALGLLGILGCAVFAVAPLGAASPWVSLPLLLGALLVGRSACVVRDAVRQELLASGALGAGLVVAFVLAVQGSDAAMPVVAAGAAVGIAFRTSWGTRLRDVPAVVGRRRWWIIGETATTGALQPIVNALLLAMLGPAASVAFRLVSTVSGAFEPILSFARTRMLVRASRADLLLSAVALGTGFLVIVMAAVTPLLDLVFRSAWSGALVLPLVVACVWRISTLATTVPFTSLRRKGRASVVYWLRLASTSAYFVLGIAAAVSGSLVAVFLAFLVAEVATCVLYAWSDRRGDVVAAPSIGAPELAVGR